jgi:hypothetical protein
MSPHQVGNRAGNAGYREARARRMLGAEDNLGVEEFGVQIHVFLFTINVLMRHGFHSIPLCYQDVDRSCGLKCCTD